MTILTLSPQPFLLAEITRKQMSQPPRREILFLCSALDPKENLCPSSKGIGVGWGRAG